MTHAFGTLEELKAGTMRALENPQPSSLFRPSGLDLLTADQLAAQLGVKR